MLGSHPIRRGDRREETRVDPAGRDGLQFGDQGTGDGAGAHDRRCGASHGGGPDPRDPTFPRGRTLASPQFGTVQEQEEIVRIRSHDFH